MTETWNGERWCSVHDGAVYMYVNNWHDQDIWPKVSELFVTPTSSTQVQHYLLSITHLHETFQSVFLVCSLDGHPVVEHAVIFTDDNTNPVQSYRGFTLMQPAWARSILKTIRHPKRSSRGATWSAMVITSVIRLTWQISPSKIERRSFSLALDDGKLIISTQRRMSSNPRLVTEDSWKTPMQ